MVNEYDQFTDGRNIILDGCLILLPKRILFGARHLYPSHEPHYRNGRWAGIVEE